MSGEAEELNFDFSDPEEGLWIWEQPVLATPDKRRGDVLVEKGSPAHSYVCGVDISTGKGKDFSAIQVFDVDTMEQVAEFMARVLPRDLVRYIDRMARWYNCATLVIERNNGGDIIVVAKEGHQRQAAASQCSEPTQGQTVEGLTLRLHDDPEQQSIAEQVHA